MLQTQGPACSELRLLGVSLAYQGTNKVGLSGVMSERMKRNAQTYHDHDLADNPLLRLGTKVETSTHDIVFIFTLFTLSVNQIRSGHRADVQDCVWS